MMCLRRLLVVASLAILSACTATLASFAVPASAPAGRVFSVVVTGSWTGVAGVCGGVLQLPNGFTVAGWATDW